MRPLSRPPWGLTPGSEPLADPTIVLATPENHILELSQALVTIIVEHGGLIDLILIT